MKTALSRILNSSGDSVLNRPAIGDKFSSLAFGPDLLSQDSTRML